MTSQICKNIDKEMHRFCQYEDCECECHKTWWQRNREMIVWDFIFPLIVLTFVTLAIIRWFQLTHG